MQVATNMERTTGTTFTTKKVVPRVSKDYIRQNHLTSCYKNNEFAKIVARKQIDRILRAALGGITS